MYTVKGYITNSAGKELPVTVLTEAPSVLDSIADAIAVWNIHDVVAVVLSPIREVIVAPPVETAQANPTTDEVEEQDVEYYTATVTEQSEENRKPNRYQMLVVAPDFATAQRTVMAQLEQGYSMTLTSLKQTKLYDVKI